MSVALIVPDWRLVAEPVVLEVPGTPDFFAHGGNVILGAEIVELLFYRTVATYDQVEHHSVIRGVMPRSGFDVSAFVAARKVSIGGRH